MWRHRSPLFTAYARDPRRRPKMGDFLNRLALDALPGELARRTTRTG